MNKNLCLIGTIFVIIICSWGCNPVNLDSYINLPSGDREALLRDALIQLYDQTETISTPDGRTLSGRQLAQIVFDTGIPLKWDDHNYCKGASCSISHCRNEVCVYEDKRPGVDPIFIAPVYIQLSAQYMHENRMGRLAGILAHEIYHRSQPFGEVEITQYEEFMAYSINAQINHSSWGNFSSYDPLNPASLQQWFTDFKLTSYLDFPAYPASIAASIEIDIHVVAQETNSTSLECHTNSLGLIECEEGE